MRAYIIQSELVKKLISLLGYSDQSLVGPVTTTIGLVAVKGTAPTTPCPCAGACARLFFADSVFFCFFSFLWRVEEGMAAIMEYGGLLPLITLLQSQDTRIQEMALTAIGRVVLAGTCLDFVALAPSRCALRAMPYWWCLPVCPTDQSSTNRQDLVYRGGLKEMIGLMTSSSPAVQLLVLGILKALAKYGSPLHPPLQSTTVLLTWHATWCRGHARTVPNGRAHGKDSPPRRPPYACLEHLWNA